MTKIYEDGTYLKNNPSWHEQDSPWKAQQILKIIEQNSLMPKSICEVGCGAGEILNQLSNHLGNDVNFTGYEISPQAYERCITKSKPNLIYKNMDFFDETDASYDIAMAVDVFEHIEDYFDFLRKFKERAEYKLFHIPLDLSVQTLFRKSPLIKSRESFGHIHYFTKDTALASLKDTNYEIVDHFYTAWSLELPNRGWKSNMFNIPKRVLAKFNKDFAVRLLGGYSLLVLAK
jgi:hypothetical protein